MKFLPEVNTDFYVNVQYILSRNIEMMTALICTFYVSTFKSAIQYMFIIQDKYT